MCTCLYVCARVCMYVHVSACMCTVLLTEAASAYTPAVDVLVLIRSFRDPLTLLVLTCSLVTKLATKLRNSSNK